MDSEMNLIIEAGVAVPESALLRRDMGNRYGSVPGLDDSELADPDELERQVLLQEFGPVLALPMFMNDIKNLARMADRIRESLKQLRYGRYLELNRQMTTLNAS